jgi:anti-sigma factor RsiW
MSSASCVRTLRLIPLYLDHEADPLEAIEIATHLLRCGACALETERARAVAAGLKEALSTTREPDIASGVMGKLRKMKRHVASGGALKWSALSILLGYMLLEISLPVPAWQTGLRALARLGELVDLDFLFSRVIDGISRFIPAPSTLLEGLVGAGSLLHRVPAFAAAGPEPALLLLAAAFSFFLFFILVAAYCVSKGAPRIGGSLPRPF